MQTYTRADVAATAGDLWWRIVYGGNAYNNRSQLFPFVYLKRKLIQRS